MVSGFRWRRGLAQPITARLTCVSARGRNFLLFLFASMLLSGPVTNTLENTERAAASLLCGAELAANQTQELMQKAATPLFCNTCMHNEHVNQHLNEHVNAVLVSQAVWMMAPPVGHVVFCVAAALDRIRAVSRNARAAAQRVENFIHALTDSVRHVGEALRSHLQLTLKLRSLCEDWRSFKWSQGDSRWMLCGPNVFKTSLNKL